MRRWRSLKLQMGFQTSSASTTWTVLNFRKYLAKHHPELDFTQLDMEEVEKEMLEDRPSEVATVDEGMPGLVGSIPTDEVVLGVIESVPIDLSPYNLP